MRKLLFITLVGLSTTAVGQNDLIYGIWEDQAMSTYRFVSLDPATATKTNIGVVPALLGFVIPGTSTINTHDSTYIFQGVDLSANTLLYNIDINTGNILNQNIFNHTVVGLEYNCVDSMIYALEEKAALDYWIVRVDPVTGAKTDVQQVPSLSAYVGGTFSFNTALEEYVFVGYNGPTQQYYRIKVQTGQMYTTAFAFNIPGQRYDCGSDSTYGMWENTTDGKYYLVAVHPSLGSFSVVDSAAGITPGYISDAFSLHTDNHTYSFYGFAGPTFTQFTLDLNNANVINANPLSFNIMGWEQFDCCEPVCVPAGSNFTVSQTTLNVGDSVNFVDNSTGDQPITYQWLFPGGTPSTSTAQNPQNIFYFTPGCYDVTLIVTNACGTDTLVKTCYIDVQAGCVAPSSGFSSSDSTLTTNDCIAFTDLSTGTGPLSYAWTFNGAIPSTSTSANPTNICYADTGCYDVTLITTNACGSDTFTLSCIDVVVPVGLKEHVLPKINIAPNPVRSGAQITLNHLPAGTYSYILYDMAGKLITSETITRSQVRLPDGMDSGMYIWQLHQNKQMISTGKIEVID